MAAASSFPRFSRHHPMLPKRYVPPWQLDMKNRTLIIKNSRLLGSSSWTGHVSNFLRGRERLSATNHQLYPSVLEYSRTLQPNRSHLSRYNSSLMTMTSY